MIIERETIDARDAARYLGMSYWMLLQHAKQGKVPHTKLGGRLLFRLRTLDVWMDEREAESVNQSGTLRKVSK